MDYTLVCISERIFNLLSSDKLFKFVCIWTNASMGVQYIYRYTYYVYKNTCMLMFMSVTFQLYYSFPRVDVIVHYECLLYNLPATNLRPLMINIEIELNTVF